jgi:type VI secretion system protein ImpA
MTAVADAAFAVDPASFLAPVPGDDPGGPSLRYEGTYDRVRQARQADDPTLSQGVWTRELKRADWAGAAALCRDALAGRSKDLQLCAWLAEAWLHLHGFEGAAAGLEVMAGVAGTFWDTLHPRGDGDQCEARGLVVEWMDGTLADALVMVPLSLPSTADAEVHPWATRDAALRLENQGRRDPAAVKAAEAAGVVTLARFDRGVSLTPTPFYAAAAAALRRAEDAAARLQAIFDARCPADTPGLLRTRGVLAAVRGWATQVLAARPDAVPDPPEEPMSADPPAVVPAVPPSDGTGAETPAPPAAVGPIAIAGRAPASRDEAYRWLEAAADFLAAAEPHSPVPYLVRRAVAWGRLPLPELMQEFQRSGYDLGTLHNVLGLEPPGR